MSHVTHMSHGTRIHFRSADFVTHTRLCFAVLCNLAHLLLAQKGPAAFVEASELLDEALGLNQHYEDAKRVALSIVSSCVSIFYEDAMRVALSIESDESFISERLFLSCDVTHACV